MKERADGQQWIIRLDPGEMIVRALTGFAARKKIGGAAVSGIGSCRNPELGFFEMGEGAYRFRTLAGDFEIASLTGNVSLSGGKPLVHLHVVLGDVESQAWAGHLKEAEVLATCEIVLVPFSAPLDRAADPETGINRIEP
jgi:predicted DNA-binding protein with PD1-like motif